MRTMTRLGILVLAAFGAKSLWDKYGAQPRRADVNGLAQRIGHTPGTSGTDPSYSPMQKAQEVSAAFEADKDRVQEPSAGRSPPAPRR